MKTAYKIDEVIGGVQWGAYSAEAVAELSQADAAALTNFLWAGMQNAGIRRGPSRPWGPDHQAVEDTLLRLRARARYE